MKKAATTGSALKHYFYRSPIGLLRIDETKGEILGLNLMKPGVSHVRSYGGNTPRILKQLREYFDGQRRRFYWKDIPRGTAFQQLVWRYCQKIPYGSTTSYSALAERMGNGRAFRAVASALSKNPTLLVIPCHRVIGSDGRLKGYAGGAKAKKWLIYHEKENK